MENRPIYATRKPGIFSCYKHALIAGASIVGAWAIFLAFLWAVVAVAGRWPDKTFAGVFAIGIVCLTALCFRDMKTKGKAASVWGGTLLLLAVAVAVRSIVGVI